MMILNIIIGDEKTGCGGLAGYRKLLSAEVMSMGIGAPWRKRLKARLPPLRSRVRVSVTPCGLAGYSKLLSAEVMSMGIGAPWRNRLKARLPPLRSRIRVSVTQCGFRGGRNGIWVGFIPFSPTTYFISRFLYAHIKHFVSFHFITPYNGATGVIDQHPWFTDLHRIS